MWKLSKNASTKLLQRSLSPPLYVLYICILHCVSGSNLGTSAKKVLGGKTCICHPPDRTWMQAETLRLNLCSKRVMMMYCSCISVPRHINPSWTQLMRHTLAETRDLAKFVSKESTCRMMLRGSGQTMLKFPLCVGGMCMINATYVVESAPQYLTVRKCCSSPDI